MSGAYWSVDLVDVTDADADLGPGAVLVARDAGTAVIAPARGAAGDLTIEGLAAGEAVKLGGELIVAGRVDSSSTCKRYYALR